MLTAQSLDTVNAETFQAACQMYADAPRLFDILAKSENPQDDIDAVLNAIAVWNEVADHGHIYTPDKNFGYGGLNADVVAETILGRRKSTAQIRRAVKDQGTI